MTLKRMRFGAFIAPHFPSNEHPSLAMEEDMDRVVLMEKLGFDEAWIGEHHSSGWEINGSPELFAAADLPFDFGPDIVGRLVEAVERELAKLPE